MNTLDFLKLLWPQNGLYLILIPAHYIDQSTGKTVNYFKHFAYPTIDEAAQQAGALASQQKNVFFALGSVKEDWTKAKKVNRDLAGRKVRGRHKSGFNNTAYIKAFWLDLDVDAEKAAAGGYAYASRDDAMNSLKGFVAAMGLPRPLVTSSGGGFHAYWPLTEEMTAEEWEGYASMLKQLSDGWGLKADPSRTADQASILRPVGTANWKTGTPRPVVVAVDAQPTDTETFLAQVQDMADKASIAPVAAYKAPMETMLGALPAHLVSADAAVNDGAVAGAGYEDPDARKVITACAQLRVQYNNPAGASEAQWYAMVGCLRFAKNGRSAVHNVSKGHPTYDPADTDAKIQQHVDGGYGPTSCAKFESTRPGGCDGCKFKGHITTPLQTVREMVQVETPILTVVNSNGDSVGAFALPPPPKPFKRTVNPLTGGARIAVTVGDSTTGGEMDMTVYENDLHPTKLVIDERTNMYTVVVRYSLPHAASRETEMPAAILQEATVFAKFFSNLGVIFDPKQVKRMVDYMIGYTKDLQNMVAASVVYAQLGWHKDEMKFVLPDRVISAKGVDRITPNRNVVNSLSWKEPKGTVEDWCKIAAVYERPGMEAHQFGFGVGFASPLFHFTGSADNGGGMMISMVGKAGAGKSTAAKMANSIWGHPTMGWADAKHDTARAFYQKLGLLKNLPATYDEHTNLDGETVSDLAYAISKGQGRQRLTQTAQAAENHGNWQLMMLMTGNTSLNGRLAQAKADASAESVRIFEYEVPSHTMAKADADYYWGSNSQLSKNYGLAGEVYIQHLIKRYDAARERVAYWVPLIDRAASVTSGERFWSSGVACVLTGFELSNQCGLTNVDITRMFNFAVNVIKGMRGVVQENTRGPEGILADYVNGNLRSTLILLSDPNGPTNAMVAHAPTDKLLIRIERHNNRMFIDRSDFRRFCASRAVDGGALQRELTSSGVLLKQDLRVTMAKGTSLSGIQSVCWVIDMAHPSLLGVGDLAAVASVTPPTHILSAVKP